MIISFICIFFLLIGFRVFGIGALDLQSLFSVFIVGLYFFDKRLAVPKQKLFASAFISFSLLAVYVSLTTGGMDLSLISRAIRVPLILLAGICIVDYLVAHRKNKSIDILRVIVIVITLNALVAILMFQFDGFRELIYRLTGARSILNETATIELGVRVPGLTYSLSQTSMFQALGVLTSVLIINNTKKVNLFWYFLLYICILVNIIACLIIGRTGLIFSLAFLFLLFLNKKNLPFILVCTLFLIPYIISLLMSFETEHFKEIESRFEEIILALTFQETRTTSLLKTMFFLPEGFRILYGGMGMGRSEFYNIISDVAYVRIIFAGGIGSIIIYMSYLCYISVVAFGCHHNKHLRNVIFICVLVFAIYSFKELFFYSRNFWGVVSLLFGVLYLNEKQKKDLFTDE